MGWMKLSRGHQGLLPKNTAYQFRAAGEPGVIVLQTCKGDCPSRSGPTSARPPESDRTPEEHTMNAPAELAKVIASQPDAIARLQGLLARQLRLPPRRVLRPHHLEDPRRPAHEPHHGRRQLPARADARRGLGLLLRQGQLRPRVRHRQPLPVGRPVCRQLQRHDEGSRHRPARELPDRADPRDLRGDARRLDQRGLRPVRRAAGNRLALRPQERQQHAPRSRGRANSPRAAWACRATCTLRTDASGSPVNRTFADVPQDQPELHPEPGFENEVHAFNLFGYLAART